MNLRYLKQSWILELNIWPTETEIMAPRAPALHEVATGIPCGGRAAPGIAASAREAGRAVAAVGKEKGGE